MVTAMGATIPHKLHLCSYVLTDMVPVVGLRFTPLVSQRSLCTLRVGATAVSSELQLHSRFSLQAGRKRDESDGYPRSRARVICAALGDGLSHRETLGISGAGLLGLMLSMNLVSVDEALAGEYADRMYIPVAL
ncbi:hypothetical protein R1flu_019769 [Riccia fluitans]|uniref:Uncharacterized protein n=1 Tax=Riccia fluitans TaxID=41844 RepID=A0ABD1ZL69_9MARC